MPINVNISSTTGSFPGGTYQLGPLQIASAFPTVQVSTLNFGSAVFKSVNSPIGSYGCLIEPPAGNTFGFLLQGTGTDTGINISATLPTLLTFGNPTINNTVGLTSGGAVITFGLVTLTFF